MKKSLKKFLSVALATAMVVVGVVAGRGTTVEAADTATGIESIKVTFTVTSMGNVSDDSLWLQYKGQDGDGFENAYMGVTETGTYSMTMTNATAPTSIQSMGFFYWNDDVVNTATIEGFTYTFDSIAINGQTLAIDSSKSWFITQSRNFTDGWSNGLFNIWSGDMTEGLVLFSNSEYYLEWNSTGLVFYRKAVETTTTTVAETTTPAETTTVAEGGTTVAETTTAAETTTPAETTTVAETTTAAETTTPAETTVAETTTVEEEKGTEKTIYLAVEEDGEYAIGLWEGGAGLTFNADLMEGSDWQYLFTKVEDGLYKISVTVDGEVSIAGLQIYKDGEEIAKSDPEWSTDKTLCVNLAAALNGDSVEVKVSGYSKDSWSFATVEEIEQETTAPSGDKTPDTGDSTMLFALLAVAVLASVVVLKKRTVTE